MSSNPTAARTAETSDPPAPPPAGGVSVTDLPPEALSFATRLFNAARTGDCEIFEQVLAYNAGVKDLRNEKGDTLVCPSTVCTEWIDEETCMGYLEG